MYKKVFLAALMLCCFAIFADNPENLLTAERWSDTSPGKYKVIGDAKKGTVDFHITGSGGVSRYFSLNPEWKTLLFQFDFRTDDVVKGKLDWQVAKMEVLFFDNANKQVGGWPKFATATGTGFKRHELLYKIPEGAVTVRITPANMGVSGDVSFQDVRVVPSENATVADLDAPPPEGTAEEHMNLQGAERQKNSYREQICMNGLWQFFPLQGEKTSNGIPAKGSGWCWFKVPGAWPCPRGENFAGNSQAIITSPFAPEIDQLKLNEAWYRREFEIPEEWSGRRIVLNFTMLQTKAKVLVDGKNAGEIDFPGGELDLTQFAVPGKRQELAILVSANPEKSGSLFMSPDVVVKISGELGFRGITGDLFLESEPMDNALSDVRIVTSVQTKTIAFDTGIRNAEPGTYLLKAVIRDNGEQVASFRSEPFRITGKSPSVRYTFSAAWIAPKLWDTHHPENLYRAEITLERADGTVCDALYPEEFGFREFRVDGRNFYLNGSIFHLRNMASGNARNGAFQSCKEIVRNTMKYIRKSRFNAIYGLDYSFKPGIVGYIDNVYRESSKEGLLSALTMPHAAQYGWLKTPEQRELYRRHAEHLIRRFQNVPGVVMYAMNHNAAGHIADQNPAMFGMPADPKYNDSNRQQALVAEDLVNAIDSSRVVYHHAGSPGNSVYSANVYLVWTPIQERSDWFEHWQKNGTRPIMISEWGNPHVASYSSYRNGASIWFGKHMQWFWPSEHHAEYLGQDSYRLTAEDKNLLDSQVLNAGKPVWIWDGFCAPFRPPSPVIHEFVRDNYTAFRLRGVSSISPWDYHLFWTKKDNGANWRHNPDAYRNLKRRGIVPDYFASSGHPDRNGDGEFELSPLGEVVYSCFADWLGRIAGKEGDMTEKGHNFAPGETVAKQLVAVNDSRENGEVICRASVPDLNFSVEKALTVPTGTVSSFPFEFKIPADFGKNALELQAEFVFPDGSRSSDSFRIDIVRPLNAIQPKAFGVFDPDGSAAQLLKKLNVKYRPVRTEKDLKGIETLLIGRRGMKDFPFSLSGKIENGLKVLVMEQEEEDLIRMGFRINVQGLRQVFSLDRGFGDMRWWRGSSTLNPPYLKLPAQETLYPVWSFCDMFANRAWRAGNRGNVASVLIEKPSVGDFLPLAEGGFDLQYAPVMEMTAGKGKAIFSQLDISGRTEPEPEALNVFAKLLARLDAPAAKTSRPVFYQGGKEGKDLLTALGIPYAEQGKPGTDALLVLGPDSRIEDHAEALKNGLDILAIAPGLPSLSAVLKPEELPVAGRWYSDYVNGLAEEPEFQGISNADLHWRKPIPLSFSAEGKGGRALRTFKIGKGRLTVCLVAPWMFDADQGQYRTSVRRSTFLLSRLLHNLGAPDNIRPLMFDREYLSRRTVLDSGWLGLADPENKGESLGFHTPGFREDGAWRSVEVNSTFEAQFDDLRNYDGRFWYRNRFSMEGPIDPNGKYELVIPAVDDESWVWLNGHFLGKVTAQTHPNNYWTVQRRHPFSGGILKKNGNVLVILCNDIHMSAGIWGNPTIRPVRDVNFYADIPEGWDNPYRYCRW